MWFLDLKKALGTKVFPINFKRAVAVAVLVVCVVSLSFITVCTLYRETSHNTSQEALIGEGSGSLLNAVKNRFVRLPIDSMKDSIASNISFVDSSPLIITAPITIP